MSWVVKTSGRLDEMSQGKLSLRIEVHRDGDITLSIDEDGIPIQDEHGNKATVEFCSIAGGGGRSPRTRKALSILRLAMILDNRKDPEGIPRFPVGLKENMEKE